MEITRQHETTTIDELTGADCTRLLGVGRNNDEGFHAWYVEANDTWYRYFVQHGILFWDTSAPDPEDDLADHEEYYDAFQRLQLLDEYRIMSITMSDGSLRLSLSCDTALIFREKEEATGMSIDNV
jgi:hypothetical protein